MKTLTGTIGVYLNPYSSMSVDDYDKCERLNAFCYGDGYPSNYIKIGTAEISVTFTARANVVANKVETLRDQLQEVRAAAQVKAKEIEQEISKLLAIEHG